MNPVRVVDWGADFIEALGEFLADKGREELGRWTVVFPHARPIRYLKRFLADSPKISRPAPLPRMAAATEFEAGLCRTLYPDAGRLADRLDQVGLLHEAVEEVRAKGKGLLAKLPPDQEGFFPWGLRLAALMEECLRQDIEPSGLAHLQGEVMDFAAALLEQLGDLYRLYLDKLAALRLATPGTMARLLASDPERAARAVDPSRICLAGFYALGGCEDRLHKTLWENGAVVAWHSDPALAHGAKPHFAVREHALWLKAWGAKAEAMGPPAPERPEARVRFFEGFDLHSQLSALSDELGGLGPGENAAVVLPDTGLLMPVLHHLPDKDVNISMGYPLARSAVFRLIRAALELQLNRDAHGRYYWRDLLGLIRHPYLRMLPMDGQQPLRPLLRQWETFLRGHEKYAGLDDFVPNPGEMPEGADPDKALALFNEAVEHTIRNFEGVSDLASLARAAGSMIDFLLDKGKELWRTYLIDAECLFRTASSTLPALGSSLVSNRPYPLSTLVGVFEHLCKSERVSFEPEPLSGLQVMGMLETRLLKPDTVFILDAVEDKLPGGSPFDPLLPDPLRHLLGLPDARERDNVAAYNFFRLLAGASKAVVFYQSGILPGLLGDKSMRSRFVELLLWEEEKRLGRVIEPGDSGILATVSYPVRPLPRENRDVAKTGPVLDRIEAHLRKKGLTPSALDAYLRCPKSFFLGRVMGLAEAEAIEEEGDRMEHGSVVHEALRSFFAPYVGRPLDLGGLPEEDFREQVRQLAATYAAGLGAEPFYRRMSMDRRLALKVAGTARLEAFLANQGPTTILALEEEAEAAIDSPIGRVALKGRLDRVDRREAGVVILDYKTGGGGGAPKGFWETPGWPERLEAWKPGDEDDPLDELADSGAGAQLPLYMHMYYTRSGRAPHDAAWVELGDMGREKPLLGARLGDEHRTRAVERFAPALAGFLTAHMLEAPTLKARRSRACAWCAFARTCGS